MWADNETAEDLLGFGFVVDQLVVALTEPRLLPVTIGLLGDWGSGKSSVLKIVRSELESPADEEGDASLRYLCVEFSPWRYEDYDDVKVALMSAVLDCLQSEVGDAAQERVSRLRRFARGLRRRSRWLGRTAMTVAPALAPMAVGEIDPGMAAESMDVVKTAAEALAGEGQRLFQEPADTSADGTAGSSDPVLEVATFRAQLAELLGTLDDVAAVVVLIDDLDRCLPESVVDTFEAIRLFLNTPKTAFVVAANQQVVESAVDSRYPQLRRANGTGIGADYLEKMLQLKIAIPALSGAEVETYINLLLAELRLTGDQFTEVLNHVAERRALNGLVVAFNLGVAEQILGADGTKGTPAELVKDLEWAAHIAPALAGGLRGNPRQIKRFLNNLMLRSRSAARRGVTLDLAVLAKLMVLEDQHFGDFRRLFDWQMEAAGSIPQLAAAEAGTRWTPIDGQTAATSDAAARQDQRRPARGASSGATVQDRSTEREGTASAPPATSEEVTEWAARPHVQAWLLLEPPLGGVDLRQYFTYSRDKLSLGVVVSRLPPDLQELLVNVQSDVPATRRKAMEAIKVLGPEQRNQVLEALLHELGRLPGGPAFAAALELAGRVPDAVPAVCEAMMSVPVRAVPAKRAQAAVLQLPDGHPAVTALLDRWQRSGVPALEGVVTIARDTRARSRH